MKRLILLLAIAPSLALADPYVITLKDVEAAALKSSPTLKSEAFQLQAAEDVDDAALTGLFPRISLNADDVYNTHVPQLNIPIPNFPPLAFGTNNNYGANVAANWTFWDSGKTYNQYKALEANAAAIRSNYEAGKRALLLQARMVYFQTQLMYERARLMADSLRLAQSESKDIEIRLQNGASSRIDSLSAKNEVLLSRGEYRQARSDLSGALRDLFALTGLGPDVDPSVPQDESTAANPPLDTEPATMSLKMDSLLDSLDTFKDVETAAFNPELPQIQAIKAEAEEAHRQADALESGHWPTFQASATAGYQYPDEVIPQVAQQNTFAVFATWPLFAFGQVNKQVKQQEALEQSQLAQSDQMGIDLERDWLKSHDHLQALTDQRALDEQSVTETENLYKLVYNSYQNGSSSLLEVQTASLHALEAKVSLASTETQMLIELAVQSSMSE